MLVTAAGGKTSLFLLCAVGPRLGNSPVPSIVQCLARKDGTDDFYQLKVSKLQAPRPSGLSSSCAEALGQSVSGVG